MKRIGKEELAAVEEVLKRDPVTLSGFYKNHNGGPSIQEFERQLAEYMGMKHAITVSNGTSALYVALLSMDIGPGDEVITTPLTFSATATAILMTGATPVFTDVSPLTYNISPREIYEAVTPKTKAILPVHLLGTPCDMTHMMHFQNEKNIAILEDNAQALGALHNGQLTGTFGTISTVSFQETKLITTGGEGGAVFTNSRYVARLIKDLRSHGSQYAQAPFLTYNYRMTEMQAAIGIEQLKKLDYFLEQQRTNAKILVDTLLEVDGIHAPDYSPDDQPTFYIIGCTTPNDFPRDEFLANLWNAGINKNLPGATVSKGYTSTIMDLPLLMPYRKHCPFAESLVRRFLWFDVTRWRTKEEVEELAKEIVTCMP